MKVQTQELRCSLAAEVLQSWGRLHLRATGISMLPTLWPGDLLTVQSHTFEQVQPGDIVLYMREGRFFVHRIKRKSGLPGEPVLLTRGDSMAEEDPPVRRTELLGVVDHIRRHGSLIVPNRKLSPFRLIRAWTLCHWSLCRRVALRLHARRSCSSFNLAVPETAS